MDVDLQDLGCYILSLNKAVLASLANYKTTVLALTTEANPGDSFLCWLLFRLQTSGQISGHADFSFSSSFVEIHEM